MNAKTNWLCTWPHNDTDLNQGLEELKRLPNVDYIILSSEEHEDGDLHRHAFIHFSRRAYFHPRKWALGGKEGHHEPARSVKKSIDYVMKDGDYVSHNFDASKFKAKLNPRAARWECPLTELRDHVNPQEYNRALQGRLTEKAFTTPAYTAPDVRGIWIYGPPGVGKSYAVRNNVHPDYLYVKPQNKWFDGYQGQTVILLDDLDTPLLSHYLKIWADRYPCSGEIKGATVALNHHHFVVTSNFSIEELFANEPPATIEAISRRFKQHRLAIPKQPFNPFDQ